MILVEETCSRGREGGFKLYLIGESSCFAEIEKFMVILAFQLVYKSDVFSARI